MCDNSSCGCKAHERHKLLTSNSVNNVEPNEN